MCGSQVPLPTAQVPSSRWSITLLLNRDNEAMRGVKIELVYLNDHPFVIIAVALVLVVIDFATSGLINIDNDFYRDNANSCFISSLTEPVTLPLILVKEHQVSSTIVCAVSYQFACKQFRRQLFSMPLAY